MSEEGYIRVNVPRAIKANEFFRVRTLAVHPMEGIERTARGEVLEKDYNFIYKCTVYFNGKEVLAITPTQSVSANPYFSFPLKISAPGELKIVYEDTKNQRYETSKKLMLA